MCLAMPMKILEIKEEGKAIAEANNVKKEINISLVSDVKEGDYVIVHAGTAIQKVCPMFVVPATYVLEPGERAGQTHVEMA